MTYEIKTSLDVFHSTVAKFVASEFPRPTIKHSTQLLDLLSDEVFGTKLTRLGPKPSPETQVAVRQVLTNRIAEAAPIPFMVPWGSKKPDGSTIDIAELSAMKVMDSLHQRIAQHYPPGAQFVLRSEDVAASWLYYERPEEAAREAKLYSDGLELLPRVLDLPHITVMRESSLTDSGTFNDAAATILPYMEDYLLYGESDGRLDNIRQLGWSGPIAQETIDYYLHLYEKLYPKHSPRDRVRVLARYFSGALARRKLGLRGNRHEWGANFIDLAFMAPIPGTENYFGKRVNYRTLPTAFSTNHMIPWRSKGVLKIANDNTVTPNLCSFSDVDGIQPNRITLTNGGLSVDLQADYKLV